MTILSWGMPVMSAKIVGATSVSASGSRGSLPQPAHSVRTVRTAAMI